MTNRSPLGSVWRHLLVAALAAAAFIATFVVGVQTTTGQAAEESVLATSRFTYDQDLLALVTVPNLLIAAVAVAVIALVRRRVATAVAGVAIIGVSSVLAQVLKHGLLVRPALLSVGDNTFPSGHMTAFTAVALALLLVVPAGIRLLVAGVGVLALSAVGILLLRHGWHRPSDVAGAILLVVCVAAISQLWVTGARPRSARWERLLLILAVLVAVLAAISVAVPAVTARLSELDSPMLTAQLGLIALVLLSVATSLWLLRHPRQVATRPATG